MSFLGLNQKGRQTLLRFPDTAPDIRILMVKYWVTGELRQLYITEGWPEQAWRQYCYQMGFIPEYIVNVRRKS